MKKLFSLFIFFKILLANENGIIFYNSFDINHTIKVKKKVPDFIFLNPQYNTFVLKDSFKSIIPSLNIAIVVNKKIFKKYLPSLINSINTYFLTKNISYNIKVFDLKSLTTAIKKYKNIIICSTEINETLINKYPTTNFYFPALNKKDLNITSPNSYFGGINYKNQIEKLSTFIPDNKAIAITSNTIISKKLLLKEASILNIQNMIYPHINYYKLSNKFIFFNVSADKTAQILSAMSNKNIITKLQLSAQINFDPLLISLTQPQDVKKLIIANSILNIPPILEDYNQILNSDIRFNWLNYSTNILLNKIYNSSTKGDAFYMNDFDTYIFNNQIEYKTKIYQIINNSFREVY